MTGKGGTESVPVYNMLDFVFDRSQSWHAGWGAGIEPWLRDENSLVADCISIGIDEAATAFVRGTMSAREALLFEEFFIGCRKFRRQVIVQIAFWPAASVTAPAAEQSPEITAV